MKLCGPTPKLTPAQLADVRAWAAQRKTARQKARELGIAESTLRAYLRGERKWAA